MHTFSITCDTAGTAKWKFACRYAVLMRARKVKKPIGSMIVARRMVSCCTSALAPGRKNLHTSVSIIISVSPRTTAESARPMVNRLRIKRSALSRPFCSCEE